MEDDIRTRKTYICRHDEAFYKRYTEINKLYSGKSFGDLALMGSKPRMASIRCLEETHFAVLSKQDFNNVLGQIERKKLNEKVQFLRSLPFFSALTKTSIGKLTYQFKELNLIKNQHLYREGERADSIYIIKSGQFEVTKTITEQSTGLLLGMKKGADPQESTKRIFRDPLKA